MLAVVMGISVNVANPMMVKAETNSVDIEQFVIDVVAAENENAWEKFASYWCDEKEEEIIALEDNVGVKSVETAELVYYNVLDNEVAQQYIDVEDISGNVQEMTFCMVGIDYTVSEVTKFFYNGVNYRVMVLGKQNDTWKIYERVDAPYELLELEQNSQRNISTYSLKSAKTSFGEALNIRNARMEGYILDGNGTICDTITENTSMAVGEAYIDNSQISTYGWRPSVSANLKCTHSYPSSIIVKGYAGIGLYNYVKDVIPNEWVISTSGAAALETGVVLIQQYAVWNVLYYQKYPDMGYDVKGNTSDQTYKQGSYNKLASSYRNKIDAAWGNASTLHMEISAGNFYEAAYGTTKINKTVSLAKQGMTCTQILHKLEDNTVTNHGSINKGVIQIKNYTTAVPHP